MKKYILTSLIVVTIIIINSCSNTKENIFEGKLKRENVSIAPKVPGRILTILVKEGDIAKAGDTLAIIDVPEVEAKVFQAKGAVLATSSQHQMAINGATKEEREQVIAMYNAALEQFQFAQKSYNRIAKMFKDSLVTAQTYDEVLAKYNAAKAQLDAAKAKKEEVVGGVRNEKIKMTEGQKNQAEGVLKEVQIAYSERYIIAPKNMSIETIALHIGELALPGYNIFVGYEIGSAYFRFSIPESKLNKFKRNQTYNINLPFSNKTITAKLVSVKELAKYANKTSAFPNYQLGEASYEIKLIPDNKSELDSLFDNYTAILKLKE